MLEKIRKNTNNLAVKIFLWLIALSFVGIGGASFVGGNDGGDVVVFDKVDSITMQEFYAAKTREIESFQNNINLTDENIKELGIDNAVLSRLIQESMIQYLSNHYDFDISEEFVGDFVKTIPYFKNDKGEFDLNIFKSAFHNSRYRESEYFQVIKKDLMKSTLLDIFKESFVVPKIMVSNIINYLAEARTVDILSIDMAYKSNNYKAPSLEDKDLEEFYQDNQSLFVIPENRSFDYIKADQSFLAKKLKITEAELKQFYNENKSEFAGETYTSAKKQAKEALTSEKLEELTSELAKNFEEDVSAGLTLQEISQKYSLKISSIKNMPLSDMNSSSMQELVELSNNVYSMVEGETSYPIEVADNNEILLVTLNAIVSERQQPFMEVKNYIKELIQKRDLANYNVKELQNAAKEYNPKKTTREALRAKGINLVSNKSLTREEAPQQDKIPTDLVQNMFVVKKGEFTQLVNDDKNLYIAYVKNITTNKSRVNKMESTSKEQFSNVIKEMLFQELLVYSSKQNNMKIKQDK
ncbi:MAG: peptidylprolyl isomerase [Rickettsiaceae bacterium]|nr:peptidylprolyl isomerase [Rickettsiaceae bacterium]